MWPCYGAHITVCMALLVCILHLTHFLLLVWSIQVSASSWVQGARPKIISPLIVSILVWCVVMTCLLVFVVSTALCARKENNSVLLSSIRRNVCQLPGSRLEGSAHLLALFQALSKVLIPDYVQSGNMLKQWCDIWQENINSIVLKCLSSTRMQHVDHGSTIKNIAHHLNWWETGYTGGILVKWAWICCSVATPAWISAPVRTLSSRRSPRILSAAVSMCSPWIKHHMVFLMRCWPWLVV